MIRNIVRYVADWLGRIGHKRGFGIQSPWAYGFVRDVIAEERPYYAYSDIEDTRCLSRNTRKVGRLLLRIANFRRPQMLLYCVSDDVLLEYLMCGCKGMKVTEYTEPSDIGISENTLLVFDAVNFPSDLVKDMNRECVVVLLGLRKYPDVLQLLKEDEGIGVTFDLGDVAVCFMRNGMYKQHYRMNF